MNEHQSAVTPGQSATHSSSVDMLDLLLVLAKHKKLLFWMPVLAGVVAGAIAFSLPPVFRASTILLPPQQAQSGAAALLSQLGGAAGMVAGAAGLKNPNDVYIGMLKSRTVADTLIKRFSLLQVYQLKSMEKARLQLEENSTVNTGKEGLITIMVEDEDPKRSAQIANAYVDELEKLTKELAVTQAAQRRLFYERQLEIAKNKLADTEVALKSAIDTHGVISVDSESRAVAETIGRLHAQVSAKEIQIGSMQAFVTSNNVEYKRAQEELDSLRSELNRLENGRPADSGQPPRSKAGFESIRMLRELKYHQMLYELMAKQYEMARLDEANDPSVIQVLDPAISPERKFKPKRGLIIVVAAITALVLAMAWALVSESFAGNAGWRHSARGRQLRSYLGLKDSRT